MRRYSAFAIAREAARYHTGWERAWRSPEPKSEYDVIIVGAGGQPNHDQRKPNMYI